jgi:hypothetical protein
LFTRIPDDDTGSFEGSLKTQGSFVKNANPVLIKRNGTEVASDLNNKIK